MFMKRRVLTVLCLALVLSNSFSIAAFAGTIVRTSLVDVSPHWTNTALMSVNLSINISGRVTMTGSVIGHPGTESISVNIRLKRVNPDGTTTHIAAWNNISTSGNIWTWEGHRYVARGHDYRVAFTATVLRNGINEVISINRTSRAN